MLQGVDHTPESVTAAIERLEANQPPADPSEPDAPGNPTPDAPGGSDGGNGGGNGGGGQQPDINPPTEPGVPEITLGAALSLAQLPAHGYRIDPDQPFVQSMQSVNSVWHTREQVESILAGASNADELELDSLYQWGILGSTLDLLEAARRDDVRVVLEQAEHIYVTEMSIRWPAYQALLEFDGFQLGATEIAYDQLSYYHMDQPRSEELGPYEIRSERHLDHVSIEDAEQRLEQAKAFFDGAHNSDELSFDATYGWSLAGRIAELLALMEKEPDWPLLSGADEIRVVDERVAKSDFDLLKQLDSFVLQDWQRVLPEFELNDDWIPELFDDWHSPYAEWLIEVEAGKTYALMFPDLPLYETYWRGQVPSVEFRNYESGDHIGYGSVRRDTEGVPYIEITAEHTGWLIAGMSLATGDESRLKDFLIVLRDADELDPATPPQPGPEAEIYLNLEDNEYVGSATLGNLFIAPIVADQMTLRDDVSIDGVGGENILQVEALPFADIGDLSRPSVTNIEIIRLIPSKQGEINSMDYGLSLGGASDIEELDIGREGWNFNVDSIFLQEVGDLEVMRVGYLYNYSSIPIIGVEGISGDRFEFVVSTETEQLEAELIAAEGASDATLLVEDGRHIEFTETEGNLGRQAAVLEMNRSADVGHGVISLNNYPHQFTENFNLEEVVINAASDLTLGVVQFGIGHSTLDGVDDRPFRLLDASSSVGNLTIDAMLERDEGGAEAQSTEWDVLLGSGDDRFVVLNSRVNGIAAPSAESSLSGGAGDDTLVLRAEVYDSWVSPPLGLEAVVEGFETLEIDGPVLDGMKIYGSLGGNAFENLVVENASGLDFSVEFSGLNLFRINESGGSHVAIEGEENPDHVPGLLVGSALAGYSDFDRYSQVSDYYQDFFTFVSSSMSHVRLGADDASGYYDSQGYILKGSDSLQSVTLENVFSQTSGDPVSEGGNVALILEDTHIKTIFHKGIKAVLVDLSGNLNGISITLPEQFVVDGSHYLDRFLLSENDINASELPWNGMPVGDPIPARIIRGFDATDELQLNIEGGVNSISELSVTFPQGGDSTDAMIEALALLSANEAGWYEFEGDTYVIGKGDAYSQAEYQGEYHYRDLLFVKLEDFVGLNESQVLPA